MERRLAAILAYDVVGYSLAMGRDEAGTLEALKSHRREVIDPKAEQHGGRTVKLMGDGLLVEFPSAVEAVQCAVEIQHMIGDRNANVPQEKRIAYRIGINIGDIVVVHRRRMVAAAAVLMAAVGGVLWWQPWTPDVEPASVERMAFPLGL